MPKVTGPLHSDHADGTVNKQLTYKKARRGGTVCKYSYPGSVKPFTPSASQLAVRARTGQIMKAWKALTTADKATWNAEATARNLQPINFFQQINFRRLAAGETLTNVYPPVEVQPLPSWITLAFTQ
jgi:hypothetical protein